MPEPKVGDKAPDFSLKSTSGETVSLGQFKGQKNVLVVRWKHVEAELGHSRPNSELLAEIQKVAG